MSSTLRRIRPILRLLPHGTRTGRPPVAPPSPPAGSVKSARLDRGSIVTYCIVCIQAGRPTEATYQTKDLLCGCDEHIHELEQHGLAAVRRAQEHASAEPVPGAMQ